MDELLGRPISDMAGRQFDCSCGRRHSVDIRKILTGTGLEKEIAELLGAFRHGTVFLMADANTCRVLGDKIIRELESRDVPFKKYIFSGEGQLIPDEKALGRLLVELDDSISAILSVGSGTLNDLARMLSSRLKIPYIIAGTAPSMDGYASVVSPLIIDGTKVTYGGVYPYAVAADIGVMQSAPMEMIQAGFGDVLGKVTALADWQLANTLHGEYLCETSRQLVRDALQKCAENAGKLAVRDEKAIGFLIEALVLTGIAMGLTGNSRPASGAEHHLAHYWEIDALSKGKEHPLHGNSVGVGTVVSASVYELLAEELPRGMALPDRKEIVRLLGEAGAHADPKALGIEREVFTQSVLHAMEIRDRYTILSFASQQGKLARIAEILTERYYD